MSVAVRPVTAADYDAWHPLWRGYQSFYRVDIDEATTRETWRRVLDQQEPMWSALAEIDGAAVGMVNFLRHRSTWTQGDYCYLQDLFAVPAARGRGVGRALIEHVYAAAKTLGCSRVHWLTQEGNATAMLLYDRIADRSGFVQYRKIL